MKLISVRGIIYTSLLCFIPKISHQIIIEKNCQSIDGIFVKIRGEDKPLIHLNGDDCTEAKNYFNISENVSNVKTYTRFSLNIKNNPEISIENVSMKDITVTPAENEVIMQIWETSKPSYEIQVYLTADRKRDLLHVTLVPSGNTYNVSAHSPQLTIRYLDNAQECSSTQSESHETHEEENVVLDQNPSRPVVIYAEDRQAVKETPRENTPTTPEISRAEPEEIPTESQQENEDNAVIIPSSVQETLSNTCEAESSYDDDQEGIQRYTPPTVIEEAMSFPDTYIAEEADVPMLSELGEEESVELTEFNQPPEDTMIIKPIGSQLNLDAVTPSASTETLEEYREPTKVELNLNKIEGWDSHIMTVVKEGVETFKTSDKSYIIGTVRCELLTVHPHAYETNRIVELQQFDSYKTLTVISTVNAAIYTKQFLIYQDGTVKYTNEPTESNQTEVDMWDKAIKVFIGTASKQFEARVNAKSFFDSGIALSSESLSHKNLILSDGVLDISNISMLNSMNVVNFGEISCYYSIDSNIKSIKAGVISLQDNIYSKQVHVCLNNNHDSIDVRLAILSKDLPEWAVFYHTLTKDKNSKWVHAVAPKIDLFDHISYSSKYLDASNRFLVLDPPEAPVETNLSTIFDFNALRLDGDNFNPRLNVSKKGRNPNALSIRFKSPKDFAEYRIDMIKYKSFEHFFNTSFRLYHIEANFSSSEGSIVCFLADRLTKAAIVFQTDRYGAYRPLDKFDGYKKYTFDYPDIAVTSHQYNKTPSGPVFDLLNNASIGSGSLQGKYEYVQLERGFVYVFKNKIDSLKLRFAPNEIEIPKGYTNLRVIVLNSSFEFGPDSVNFEYILNSKYISFTYQFFNASDHFYNRILPITSRPSTPTKYSGSDLTDYRDVEHQYNPTTILYGKRAFMNILGSYVTQSEIDLNTHGKLPSDIIDYKNEVKDSVKSGTLTTSSDSAVVGTFIGGNIYLSVKPLETSRRVDYIVHNTGVKEFNVVSVVGWKLVQQKFLETAKNSNIFYPC